MGLVYRDSPKPGSTPIAYFEAGVVYDKPPGALSDELRYVDNMPDRDPSSWGANVVGYYEGGAIFKNLPLWGDAPVGYYREGEIYNRPVVEGAAAIGFCEAGTIYYAPSGAERTPVAYYVGTSDGAAAAVMLLGLIPDNAEESS